MFDIFSVLKYLLRPSTSSTLMYIFSVDVHFLRPSIFSPLMYIFSADGQLLCSKIGHIWRELSPYKEKIFLNEEVSSSMEKFCPQRRSFILNGEVSSSMEMFFLNRDLFLQYRRFFLHEKKGSTKNKFVIIIHFDYKKVVRKKRFKNQNGLLQICF